MAIKIISKRNGFRRCGVEHPDKPVIHPAGRFTEEQIRQLKAEPMLVVEEIPDEQPVKEKGAGKGKGDKGEADKAETDKSDGK